MKRYASAFAVVAATLATVLACSLAAPTPARADYAVVQFGDGYRQIWSDAADTPWGTNWMKIAITPDWSMAQAALDDAIANRVCN
jgi:hypothetical protein